ncbi:MAG: hypothetical protein JNL05_08250 [Flavobacteriales bacterium]|nr:hypothetical protein [Flavobacteriales bacterium]
MARIITVLVGLVALPLLAGLYGALHDQLSFTIAPEYFTRFKYDQFGFEPQWFGGHRPTVAVIGFLATWWVGALIALFLVPLGLVFKDTERMRKEIVRATMITLGTAAVCALLGLAYGWYLLDTVPNGWYLPPGLEDPHAFLAVGSMHNFSYAGGALGLCLAVTVMVWRRKQAA